jgi:rSAM/selenodomain-associated transferase 2
MNRVSIVVPVLDEEAVIVEALEALACMRRRCDLVLSSRRGRALQMNAGAAAARGTVLIFLHADTSLPPDADRLVVAGLNRTGRLWGRFDVRLLGRHPLLSVIACSMNYRSRLTGIATGDQAIFVTRQAFAGAGGFPFVALMEDILISRRLKQLGPPLCIAAPALTSARRWEKAGVIRTVLLMWRLRLALFLGAEPDRLAQRYQDVRTDP